VSVQRRVFVLILIMTLVSGGIGVAAVGLLYRAAFREEQQRLTEIAKSHAGLIEAVGHFDDSYSHHYPGGARSATLSQLKHAHGVYQGFGKTGEFTLAERRGDAIDYLLPLRHTTADVSQRIPIDSGLAEPMRRALAGQSGTLIGLDYRGARVLAAYEPVATLDLGIVAKIDLAEVRAPFVRAGVMVGGTALLLIAAGTLLFFRVSKPILQRIADSEQKFRGISTAAQDAIVMADSTGKVRFWNRAAERLLGYSPDEANGRLLTHLIVPARHRRHLAACAGFLHGQGRVVNRTLELEAKRKDETEVPVEISVSGLQLGEEWHSVSIIRDMTERKRAEEEIKQREERLRLILASTGEGIFGLDAKGRCTFANRACVELLGFAREEDLLGKDMHRLVHHTRQDGTPYPPDACPTYRSLVARQGTFSEDELLWRSDGTAFHAEYQSYPTLRDDQVVGAVVSFADIGARKRAEAAIKQERDFAERLIETAPVIVLVLDAAGRILRVNSFFERLSGYSRDEVKGRHWRDTLTPMGGSLAAAGPGPASRGEFPTTGRIDTILARDGKERLIAWYDTTLRDALGEPSAVLAVGHDVTDQKAKEAQLLQAQKMEMIGQLTGGIAHDFNNLLTVILGNLDLLAKTIGTECGPEVEDLLMDSLSAAEDGAELTERLLAFSRKTPLKRKPIDLHAFLTRFRRFLNRTLGPDIAVEVDIDEVLDTLASDPPQLESALLNLALNARDAMPEGGRILLRARAREACELKENLAPGSYVEIAVVDTGMGMTSGQLARAVEPFYTTKASRQGSGLGLTMVFGFCEQAGGAFRLESEPGRGTRAKILLPLHAPDCEEWSEGSGREAALVTGSGTVLVVEDEERVRKLAGRYLQDLGYQVLTAADGETAIAILESELEIGLVFSDLVMPGEISGYDLYFWIRERRPATKVLLATGLRSPEVRALAARGASEQPVILSKPYSKEQLAEAMRALVAP